MVRQIFPTFARLFVSGPGSRWRIATLASGESMVNRERSLLRLFSIAHSEQLNLSRLVNNLASEHHLFYRQRLRQLARRLSGGTPLIEALEQTPGVLSDQKILELRFASQSGLLKETLDRLVNEKAPPTESRPVDALIYPLAVLFTLTLCLMFLMIVCVPKIQEIAREMGVELTILSGLISLCQFIAGFWYVWPLLLIGLIWLLTSSASRRYFNRAAASKCLHSFEQLRIADLMRMLAPAVDSGRPLAGALSTLARYHYDQHIRMRLLYARNEIEQGADTWKSLLSAGLISDREAQSLHRASSNEARAWLMREIAEQRTSLIRQRSLVLASIAQPVLILALGALVLWVALGFISFLALTIG